VERRLAWILVVSLVLKLGLAFFAERNDPVLDERAYLQIAQELAQTGRFEGTFRPPLYPAFEALLLAAGLGTLGIRIVQTLLSTFTVLQVHGLARRASGDPRVANLAAFLVAFDPALVAFSHRLWSETLFVALFLGFVAGALRAFAGPEAPGRAGWAALAGALLGLAALARPMVVALAPLLALPVLVQMARARRAGGPPLRPVVARLVALAGAAALVILPWTIRNWNATGAFVLVDSNGPFNFLVGAEPQTRFVVKDDRWDGRFGSIDGVEYPDLVARDAAKAQDLALERGLAHVRADPAGFAAKCAWEAGHLWTLDSFLLRHLRNGWYGAIPLPLVAAATVVSVAWFALLAVGGLAGLTLGRGLSPPLRATSLLVIAGFTALFGATYALSRYALPLHPLLAIGAAALLAAPREAWRRHRTSPGAARRTAVAALLLAALLAAWSRDLPLMKDMLVSGGQNHRYRIDARRRRRSGRGRTP
jgi:4-amino-4-deoxy-L-arabinose transferase-like glycosyltransferase